MLKEKEGAWGLLGFYTERLEEKEGDKSNNAIHRGKKVQGPSFAPSFKPSFLSGARALFVFRNTVLNSVIIISEGSSSSILTIGK